MYINGRILKGVLSTWRCHDIVVSTSITESPRFRFTGFDAGSTLAICVWVTCGARIFAVHSSRLDTLLGSLVLHNTLPGYVQNRRLG